MAKRRGATWTGRQSITGQDRFNAIKIWIFSNPHHLCWTCYHWNFKITHLSWCPLINPMSNIKDKADSGPVWHFGWTWVGWLIKKMLTPCSTVIFIEKQRISIMIDGACLPGIMVQRTSNCSLLLDVVLAATLLAITFAIGACGAEGCRRQDWGKH